MTYDLKRLFLKDDKNHPLHDDKIILINKLCICASISTTSPSAKTL